MQRTFRTGQTVTIVMIFQTVQCGGTEYRETVTGLTDCKYGGKGVKRGVFNVLVGVSKIHFVTIECDIAHCYTEAKFRKCDRPFGAKIVRHKIVKLAVNLLAPELFF